MTHPLTYEVFGAIRSTVDEPGDGVIAYMRAGADWQLEADAHWWKLILKEVGFLPPNALDQVIEEFKQAMRPQEDNS